MIYRRGYKWSEVLENLRARFPTGPAAAFHIFLGTGTRGFVQERRMPPQATTLKIRSADTDDKSSGRSTETAAEDLKTKAG